MQQMEVAIAEVGDDFEELSIIAESQLKLLIHFDTLVLEELVQERKLDVREVRGVEVRVVLGVEPFRILEDRKGD